MDTQSLKQRVREVVAGYAGKALNGFSFLTQSEDGSVLMVFDVARSQGKHTSSVSLIVRIFDQWIIVERDQNDKLVLDALLQTGIPRSQIILAYAGEPVPEMIV